MNTWCFPWSTLKRWVLHAFCEVFDAFHEVLEQRSQQEQQQILSHGQLRKNASSKKVRKVQGGQISFG